MQYNLEETIEVMNKRGYSHTATNGDKTLVYFLKNLEQPFHVHATVFLKKQTVELDNAGILRLGIDMLCPSIPLDSEKFEHFETVLFNYSYLCYYGKLRDTMENDPEWVLRCDALSATTKGTDSKTISSGRSGGVEKGEGKPEKPKATVEERKAKFWEEVKGVAKQKGYPKELALEFYKYWVELNKSKTKFRREAENYFDIPKRFATWIKNNQKWSKQNFTEQKIEKQNAELSERKKIKKHKELF